MSIYVNQNRKVVFTYANVSETNICSSNERGSKMKILKNRNIIVNIRITLLNTVLKIYKRKKVDLNVQYRLVGIKFDHQSYK